MVFSAQFRLHYTLKTAIYHINSYFGWNLQIFASWLFIAI